MRQAQTPICRFFNALRASFELLMLHRNATATNFVLSTFVDTLRWLARAPLQRHQRRNAYELHALLYEFNFNNYTMAPGVETAGSNF
jgi:hypothetical protein